MKRAIKRRDATRMFAAGNTTTEAQVLRRDTGTESHAGEDVPWYALVFEFSVPSDTGDERIALQLRISKKLYDTTYVGQTLTVQFANANPCIALIEGERRVYDPSLN